MFSGMNGENASSDTLTGIAGSRYSTQPIGYSPVKRDLAPAGPVQRADLNLPPAATCSAKPCSSGEAGVSGLA